MLNAARLRVLREVAHRGSVSRAALTVGSTTGAPRSADDPVAWMPPVQDTLGAWLLGGDGAGGERLGLLLGGAIGNLIDRVAQGSVTDFIKLPLWPAFNVGDMAITFGVLALLWVLEGPSDGSR